MLDKRASGAPDLTDYTILRVDTLIGGTKHGEELAIPPDETDVVFPVMQPLTVDEMHKAGHVPWHEVRYRVQRMRGPKDSRTVLEFFADERLDGDQACAIAWDTLTRKLGYPKP